jgi:hypothetical protein
LQAEFGTEGAYLGYAQAKSEGRISVVARKTVG